MVGGPVGAKGGKMACAQTLDRYMGPMKKNSTRPTTTVGGGGRAGEFFIGHATTGRERPRPPESHVGWVGALRLALPPRGNFVLTRPGLT